MQMLDKNYDMLKELSPKDNEEALKEFREALVNPDVREVRFTKELPFAGFKKDELFKKK